MTTPTDRQITQLFKPLHNLGRHTTTNGPTNLEHLERRLLDACHRNRTADTGVRTRDGYPTGNGPGDGGQDAPDSTTQAAALANIGELYDGHPHTRRDPVGDIVNELYATLVETVGGLTRLQTLLTQLDKISDPRRTTNPTASCQACDRIVECTSADPIRAGYCNACDTAWRRWKQAELEHSRQPDRARFEHWRRQQLAAA
jgi:hypothetical protein